MQAEERVNLDAICLAAVKRWGPAQLIILLEELAELQQSLVKYLRYGNQYLDDIAEEVADVQIMLHQLTLMLNLSDRISEMREEKLKKLKAILDNDHDSTMGGIHG